MQDLGLPLAGGRSPAFSTAKYQPVVAILGSTGTGKSQLAVEIAEHLATTSSPAQDWPRGGGVISVDSMQMYRGLDIITNKATPEEQGQVEHYLMSFLDIEETYDVARFVQEAKQIAETKIIAKRQLPILCGGTTYYMQHLLFPGNVVTARGTEASSGDPNESHGEPDTSVGAVMPPQDDELAAAMDGLTIANRSTWQAILTSATKTSVHDLPSARDLWDLLDALDPVMARRWHPSDARKITNSLRVIASTGKRHSHWVAEQDAAAAARSADGVLSSNDDVVRWAGKPVRVLFFLVYASRNRLNERLNARIGTMIERGLLKELQELRTAATSQSSGIDHTKGIFQSIGYKEFEPFLDKLDEYVRDSEVDAVLDNLDPAALSRELKQLFDRGVEEMKTATRQYAKKQLMWTKNKLLPEIRRRQERGEQVDIVLLDTSDKGAWDSQVRAPALRILDAFLSGQELPREYCNNEAYRTEIEPLLRPRPVPDAQSEVEVSNSLSDNAHLLCATCTEASPGGKEVYYRHADESKHHAGKTHRRALNWNRKQERLRNGERLGASEEAIARKRAERAARRKEVEPSEL
ncbi:unnamed protein product [Parajaminaea phylloscopi]